MLPISSRIFPEAHNGHEYVHSCLTASIGCVSPRLDFGRLCPVYTVFTSFALRTMFLAMASWTENLLWLCPHDYGLATKVLGNYGHWLILLWLSSWPAMSRTIVYLYLIFYTVSLLIMLWSTVFCTTVIVILSSKSMMLAIFVQSTNIKYQGLS